MRWIEIIIALSIITFAVLEIIDIFKKCVTP